MRIKYVAIVIAFLVSACSKETIGPTSPQDAMDSFLALYPSDGETSVRLDAPVILTFTKPVDRATVERGFHLVSEKAMADSICPVSQTMGHGNMTDSMVDTSKMHHLNQYHSSRGRFIWNVEGTRCTFEPDSMMTPRTLYMVHMDREMTQMMEQRLGSMGMMGGHGTGFMSGEMMFHYFTMDTTGSGSGHSGHH